MMVYYILTVNSQIMDTEVDDAGDRAGRALRYPSVHGRAGAGSRGTGGSGPRPSPGGGGIREAHRTAVRSRRGQDRGHGRCGYRRAGAVVNLSWGGAARLGRGGDARPRGERQLGGGGKTPTGPFWRVCPAFQPRPTRP